MRERLHLARIRDAVKDYDYHDDRDGSGWYRIQKVLAGYDAFIASL